MPLADALGGMFGDHGHDQVSSFELIRDGLFRTQIQIQGVVLSRRNPHPQVTSAAGPDGHQPSRFERMQNASQGVSADVELLHEPPLRRQPVPRLELQVLNDLPQFIQGLVLLSHAVSSLRF